MTRQEIKQRAKDQLGNNIFSSKWLIALLVCLIQSAVISLCGTFTAGIVSIIILGPLQYGVCYLFLKQTRDNGEMNVGDIFKGFSEHFPQTFLIGLMTTIFTFLWSLLFIIPGIVKGLSYSMAFYVKADHPEYEWNTCIKESMRITNGHKGELFVLYLSFIGWLFVGALCFGIGTLWVMPYISASEAQFYESIKQ